MRVSSRLRTDAEAMVLRVMVLRVMVLWVTVLRLMMVVRVMVRSGTLLTSTQTVRRERGSTGWLMAYRASWRDYLDVDGAYSSCYTDRLWAIHMLW
jgi:hypothetical protein